MASLREFASISWSALVTVLIGLLGLLLGCQNPQRPPGHWYKTSPQSSSELGFIVDQISPQRIRELVKAGKISARVLSERSGTYEIYGVSKEEVSQLFPNKPVTPNAFIGFREPSRSESVLKQEPPFPLPQLQIINAPKAWKWSKGKGVKIAVIDTGLNWDHQDFAELPLAADHDAGWNFGDDNDDVSDPTDHGTTVAGLIASRVLGVAPEARIIPLKVINSSFKIDEASVIAAIRHALEKNISLIHISLGRPALSEVFLGVLKEVEFKGSLIIAAAGNQGRSCKDFQLYPASYASPSVLSVGATLLDIKNPFLMAPYSNYGDCVSIAAPGGYIHEELWAPVWFQSRSLYGPVLGTSMAAPLVMGAAALLKSRYPDWTGPQIRSTLLETAKKSPLLQQSVKSEGLLFIEKPPAAKKSSLLSL